LALTKSTPAKRPRMMLARFFGLVGSRKMTSPKTATGILFRAPTREYIVAVVCRCYNNTTTKKNLSIHVVVPPSYQLSTKRSHQCYETKEIVALRLGSLGNSQRP